MWLLNARTYELKSFEGANIPKHAILSHRSEEDEISFKEVLKSRGRHKKGWSKVKSCCKQALRDGLAYAWADTCCIDKRGSAEPSEAISSMYNWYKSATVCYAFLSDLPMDRAGAEVTRFTASAWFTRGWTLQEFLASKHVVFYDRYWQMIDTKANQAEAIADRTHIPREAVQIFKRWQYCVAQLMSWAIGRQTTRLEDQAYSLLGLLDVNMPYYTVRQEELFRLQNEIMRPSKDSRIFAWSKDPSPYNNICASSSMSCKQARLTKFCNPQGL